ncbi:hypothetical protein ACLMAJ_28530 [Nocardia sp. KC 131]|uniref:hypothetical protein n=1 Tax=Nocardia arseniciresistens TaxID=3392119 RepID=UPI00398F73BD
MDMTLPTAASSARRVPRGLTPASVVLGGTLLSLVGLSWDIQWHNDVGPDTFFTLPHLFLYAGSAAAGLASLVVVLATTAAQRWGRPVDPIVGGRVVGVFGRTFAAPVGYLISGCGAASFLLYGLWDQWWHGLYGFDAMIASPPHIGLLLSITVTMVGAVMVFATAREHRWGVLGMIVSTAILVAFSMVTVIGLQAVSDGNEAVDVGVAFMCVLLLMMCARALDRPGGVLGVAVVVAGMQAVLWWFSPWAAEAYAVAVGLPLRDYLDDVPTLPGFIPMALVVVAGLVESLRRLPGWVVGAIGSTVLGVCAPLQRAWLHGNDMPELSAVLVVAAVAVGFGAVAGFLGTRFGGLLRHLAPEKETNHA